MKRGWWIAGLAGALALGAGALGSTAAAHQPAAAQQPLAAQAPPSPPGAASATPLHPARRIPQTADFPTGPAIGERLPDFTLRNQRGEAIDFHADRAGHRAAVLFQRSAVW